MSEGFWKKSKIAVLAVLVLSLIPMLLVAIYARPLADDFGYSAGTRAVWQASHNIFLVLGSVGAQVAKTYVDWQGSFSAIALFALQPGLFSEKIYGLGTVVLVALFVWGNLYFFRGVFDGAGKAGDGANGAVGKAGGSPDGAVVRNVAMIVAGAVLIVSMQTLPHANQGFYWWNGASYYCLFYSFMLLQWGMIVRKKRVVLPSILGFMLGGGNLVTGLLNLEVTALLLLVAVIEMVKGAHKAKGVVDGEIAAGGRKAPERLRLVKLAVIMAFSLAGFIVNAAAPGNAVRASESVSMGAVEAIGQSFIDAYQYFGEWMNLPVVLLLLFVLPFIWFGFASADCDEADCFVRRIPMFLLVLLAFGLFASTYTPTEFSMSEVGPRRIQNVRYFVFIVFMVLLEAEAVVRVRSALYGDGNSFAQGEADSGRFGKLLAGYMLALAAGAVVFLGIYTVPKDNRNTVTSIAAARSFLIGESQAYARERDEWTALLSTEDKVVELPALGNHPVPIYYAEFDIKGNPEDYRDQSMCDYYGKDEIVLLQKGE